MTRIDDVVPGLADGKPDELFEKVKSIRELAESFNKKSGAFMEEGRRSLLDISQARRQGDPQIRTASRKRQRAASAAKAEPEAAHRRLNVKTRLGLGAGRTPPKRVPWTAAGRGTHHRASGECSRASWTVGWRKADCITSEAARSSSP